MQLSAQQAFPIENVSNLKIELHVSTTVWADELEHGIMLVCVL